MMSNTIFGLHCPSCGKRISESDHLCPHCGINLDAPLEKTELEALAQEYLAKAQKAFESGRNIKRSLVNCEQALEYAPELAEAHNLRGLILDALGQTDEAILAYQEAIRLKPDFADAQANLEDAEAENNDVQSKDSNKSSIRQTTNWKRIVVATAIIGIVLCVLAGLGVFYVLWIRFFRVRNRSD